MCHARVGLTENVNKTFKTRKTSELLKDKEIELPKTKYVCKLISSTEYLSKLCAFVKNFND